MNKTSRTRKKIMCQVWLIWLLLKKDIRFPKPIPTSILIDHFINSCLHVFETVLTLLISESETRNTYQGHPGMWTISECCWFRQSKPKQNSAYPKKKCHQSYWSQNKLYKNVTYTRSWVQESRLAGSWLVCTFGFSPGFYSRLKTILTLPYNK